MSATPPYSLLLATGMLITATPCWAQVRAGAEGPTYIECEPSSSRLFIVPSRERIAERPFGSQGVATSVDWYTLIRYDKKDWRAGTRTRSVSCGQFTVRISAGYLNSNPSGEMGAINHAVVEIFRGRTPVVAPTALSSCTTRLVIYRGQGGGCPDGWAVSMAIERYEFGPQYILVLNREFEDEKMELPSRTDRVLLP